MDANKDDSLLILGRQPALSLVELESLYGADAVGPVGCGAALIKVMPCSVDFPRLGGSVKLCKILAVLPTTSWPETISFLVEAAPSQSTKMPTGKMHLGLSVLGFKLSPAKIQAGGLSIKKAITKTGRSVRLVPNTTSELNSAQVIHNKLLSENGWELVIVRGGDKTIIAQSLAVQDIASYTRRDRGRPKRDPRVGMLPPKLAQIIINLAVGKNQPGKNFRLLDPFCGTGVILQEAMLMGYSTVGSDIEPRMISYCQQNLDWLGLKKASYVLLAADATAAKWQHQIDTVASETYLGRPFTNPPSPEILAKTAAECNLIIKKFLRNIQGQLKSGTRLCLAVPAWQAAPDQFKYLPLVDQISDLGYNRVSFQHASDKELVYYREKQLVARQLLILTRK